MLDHARASAPPRRTRPHPGPPVGALARRARRDPPLIEKRCWSQRLGSYTRAAGLEELDASLLLGALMGYAGGGERRLAATVERVSGTLARGPLVLRYQGDDGLPGGEGAFLACSFWLVDALARHGRTDQAGSLMDQLLALANDVGLYAEEIDPATRAFLGNFPQALVHLAVINAAASIAKASG